MSDQLPPDSPWDQPYQGDPPPQPPQQNPYGSPPPQQNPYGAPPPQQGPYGAPPQPGPYGPPPPGYYGGAPVKKDNTTRNVLLAVLAVVVLVFGGCTAVGVVALIGVGSEISEGIDEAVSDPQPVAVELGDAFTYDGLEVAPGWRVTSDGFGSQTLGRVRVTVVEEEPYLDLRSPSLVFRFLRGGESLGEVTCSGNRVRLGEETTLDCFTTTRRVPQSYDRIEVGGLF